MKKSLIISEADSIAALLENDRVVEFFVNRGELLLGDIYTATVENILPGIDAAFVNLGKDKMGFLHANDVPGQGTLKEKLVPKQKQLVQITKEPTGHKGPRVSTAISLPGRFLVLVPEERGVSISRRISEAKERSRLKAIVNLIKPPGVGLIIRTEAKGQGESELFEDFEQLWDRWQTIVSDGEASIGPTLIYRDQDLLFRVIRDAYSTEVSEIIVDSADGQKRALDYMTGWASRTTKVLQHMGEEPLLIARGVDKEIEAALSDRVELPSGGHLNIQPTEALTVIDVNSGRFTSSRTQAETVRRTNLEASQEIPRQLRLRNIGGMVIVDFIDMDSRRDQQQVLEQFQRALEDDRAKPQIGQLSDLGLVELTRRRQGQSLRELFTVHCTSCAGHGVVPTLELGAGEQKRVISFPKKDEEASSKKSAKKGLGRQGGGGGMMRAATASGGRIKPILVEPEVEEFEEVPDEILEQVPDDILGDTRGYSKSGHASHLEMDEEEEVRRSAPAPRGSFYDGAALAEDEDEDEEFVSVEPVPAAVGDEVFDEEDEDEEEEGEVNGGRGLDTERFASSMYSQADEEEAPIDDDDDDEEEQEITDVIPVAESPYETEIDPVTGIYRLKTRQNPSPAFATDDRQSDTEYGARESAMEVSPEGEISGESEFIHHTEPIHTASSIDLSGNVQWESEEQAPTPENDWWKGSSEEAQQLNIPMPNEEEESDDEANQFAHREQD